MSQAFKPFRIYAYQAHRDVVRVVTIYEVSHYFVRDAGQIQTVVVNLSSQRGRLCVCTPCDRAEGSERCCRLHYRYSQIADHVDSLLITSKGWRHMRLASFGVIASKGVGNMSSFSLRIVRCMFGFDVIWIHRNTC